MLTFVNMQKQRRLTPLKPRYDALNALKLNPVITSYKRYSLNGFL